MLLIPLFLGCADDSEPRVSRLIAFGGSFADQGNYRPVAEAAGVPDAGRFTTDPDPMWIVHVATRLGVRILPSIDGGTNYAEGFARNALPAPPRPGLSQTSIAEQARRFVARDMYGAHEKGALERVVSYLETVVPGVVGVEREQTGHMETISFKQTVSGAEASVELPGARHVGRHAARPRDTRRTVPGGA